MDDKQKTVGSIVAGLGPDALKWYRQAAEKHPRLKYALDMAPPTGWVTSLADAVSDANQGEYKKALIDLLGVVPGAKNITGSGFVKDAAKFVGKRYSAARGIDKVNDTDDAIAAGALPEFKRGGRVSMPKGARGDGCAQRGKTKGRCV